MEENNKKNNFEEYGFTADFKGEIFFEDNARLLIGKLDDNTACFWDSINGHCFEIYTNKRVSMYDLTPIEKEWYEKEENFPCVIFNKKTKMLCVINNIFDWNSSFENTSKYRPATKEDLLSLLVEV